MASSEGDMDHGLLELGDIEHGLRELGGMHHVLLRRRHAPVLLASKPGSESAKRNQMKLEAMHVDSSRGASAWRRTPPEEPLHGELQLTTMAFSCHPRAEFQSRPRDREIPASGMKRFLYMA